MMQFITLLCMCILGGMEIDLFVPSFPELQADFNLSTFMVELTLGLNFFAYCISSLVAGNLGDRYGYRPIILMGTFIFIIGSVFCYFAHDFHHILIGRFLQGLGMPGPATLAFVVVARLYSIEEQRRYLGILNAGTSFAMSFSPLIGSYVNIYFSWKGNFFILLVFGIICFLMGYKYIQPIEGKKDVSLSFRAYIPLMKSSKVLYYMGMLCFISMPYWIFSGFSPIIYMQDMKVSITHFGYYQGIFACLYSIVSISSESMIRRFGIKKCLNTTFFFCGVGVIFLIILGIQETKNPLLLTFVLLIITASVVLPMHIFYPLFLETYDNAKGRLTALFYAFRLLFVSLSLQGISYFHEGSIRPTAFLLSFYYIVTFILFYKLSQKFKPFKDKT